MIVTIIWLPSGHQGRIFRLRIPVKEMPTQIYLVKISRLESRVGTISISRWTRRTSRRATRKYLVETLKNSFFSNPARYNLPICNSSSIANRFLKFKFDRNEKMFIIHSSNFQSDFIFEFNAKIPKFYDLKVVISIGIRKDDDSTCLKLENAFGMLLSFQLHFQLSNCKRFFPS